jgi:hypothetical protein
MLSSTNIATLKAYKKIAKKVSQLDYYISKGSPPEVLKIVGLGNKAFGGAIEDIVRELFALGPRTSSQNDATFGQRKIEIKAARYWAGKDDCKWQHLEPDHDYDLALLVLQDFQGLKLWAINKQLLMGELRDKKIVTFQGKQGWWTTKRAILPYLTEIHSLADLEPFRTQTSAPPMASLPQGAPVPSE